jgi:hypothetical protein
MQHTYYTIEVYYRRKWSDRYSLQYPTYEEAVESARHLYKDDPDNKAGVPIFNFYRIKETKTEENIIEIENIPPEDTGWEERSERLAYHNNN